MKIMGQSKILDFRFLKVQRPNRLGCWKILIILQNVHVQWLIEGQVTNSITTS